MRRVPEGAAARGALRGRTRPRMNRPRPRIRLKTNHALAPSTNTEIMANQFEWSRRRIHSNAGGEWVGH